MTQQLENGTKLNFSAGECLVKELLGSGGQGEVYKVEFAGKEYALKWYFPTTANPKFKNSLKKLVNSGAPNDRFLWPLFMIETNDNFGYIMQLRPPAYKNFNGLLKRTYSLTYSQIITAAIQLLYAFRKLHNKGLSYQDISTGNIFLNDTDGSILICDNDNITSHGESTGGVLGTPKFMAPEIVRGEHLPDSYTDAYSIAVLLFYLMFLGHPLDGEKWANFKCLDAFAMNKLYGFEPIFIFDPDNDQNRPVPGMQDNPLIFWHKMYPGFIREIFVKIFTKGLTDRENGRLLENDWIDVFRKLRESIIYCPKCSREVIYDIDKIRAQGKLFCWSPSCGSEVIPPPRIRIKNTMKELRIVMLNAAAKLYAYQISSKQIAGEAGDTVVGEVVQHPQNPGVWGLKNLSQENWHYTNDNGAIIDVTQGKSVTLKSGIIIDFGQVTGEIRG